MPKTSRTETPTQGREQRARKAGILWTAYVLAFCALSVTPVGAKGLPVDQRGARMMSYRTLIENREKLDRKLVWVIGGLTFRNGTALLGDESGIQKGSKESVCVAPIESFTDRSGSSGMKTLRRFDGVSPLSLHGRYESNAGANCPNGTVFVALLEISFE
jgi:hypothetical protein